MKVRYCQTSAGKDHPCRLGKSAYIKNCFDEPKEENCKYLVEERSKVKYCPTCGTQLWTKEW